MGVPIDGLAEATYISALIKDSYISRIQHDAHDFILHLCKVVLDEQSVFNKFDALVFEPMIA